MRTALAILFTRLLRKLIRLFRRGGGSALPGKILVKLDPGLLDRTLQNFPQGLVVVSGSAGKSTTTKMLVAILRDHGLKVFTNPSTANIMQGYYTAILERANLRGQIADDIAVLEMDEGHAALLMTRLRARLVVLLNVTDDQLDRFVDPSLVRAKLAAVAGSATDALVLNADDQNLLLLHETNAESLASTSWFGLGPNLRGTHNLGYAQTFLPEITAPAANTRVTELSGRRVSVAFGSAVAEFELPNRGLHYALDAAAALESANRLLGERFSLPRAIQTLDELPPVFARGELTNVRGKRVEFILVQNPASFQLNLDFLKPKPSRIMLAIGRDVHDPSWLWTVDFSELSHIDVLSGFNFAEAGLRLGYAEVPVYTVEPDLGAAFDKFLSLDNSDSTPYTVLFSADAMRRLRRHLGYSGPDEVTR